jgi:hypothetical protein
MENKEQPEPWNSDKKLNVFSIKLAWHSGMQRLLGKMLFNN